MSDSARITVSRTIAAPVERVFALLADPDRHPDIDGSGMVRGSRTHTVLTDVGDVFTMDMYVEQLGEYQTDNVVTSYQRDVEIGWSPGPAGRPQLGHTYTYALRQNGDDLTDVTLNYDWSSVTDERVLPMLPFVSADQLGSSLALLAEVLEKP
ncbi:SRPBCC family protein [Pseudonocardia spinosispora]|uniref:SRPBCC family protein n=1 Tax=Pseudonocardia spinosispora TaxID=103441 RepID=UPI000491ED39|nr:SRPBCC family protein [Pseudonocardia spinosispora]